MQAHARIFHVLFDPGDKVYVVNKKFFKEVLADVPPVGKQLAEKFPGEHGILERFPVVHVSWCQHPLYDLAPVVDDKVQLEAIEPAHRAFALGRPSLHRLVDAFTFDVAGRERRRVYDGYARALARGHKSAGTAAGGRRPKPVFQRNGCRTVCLENTHACGSRRSRGKTS